MHDSQNHEHVIQHIMDHYHKDTLLFAFMSFSPSQSGRDEMHQTILVTRFTESIQGDSVNTKRHLQHVCAALKHLHVCRERRLKPLALLQLSVVYKPHCQQSVNTRKIEMKPKLDIFNQYLLN